MTRLTHLLKRVLSGSNKYWVLACLLVVSVAFAKSFDVLKVKGDATVGKLIVDSLSLDGSTLLSTGGLIIDVDPGGPLFIRDGSEGIANECWVSNNTTGQGNWDTCPSAASGSSPYQIENLGLAGSVGSSALTLSLKQSDGSTDATGGGPKKRS